MIQDAVVTGSSVVEVGFLFSYQLKWGKWHRSKDVKGGYNPYGAIMLNKKWTMEEEFNIHMFRFRQVTSEFYLFQ